MEQVERIYRSKYNIYNPLFYNVDYGIIGKRCFTPRWRCISYMEIAPLAPLLHLWPLVYTPGMTKALHITKRKRETNIQHHRQANDFRAGFKVAKWRVFCHSAWLQISPARFKQVYSDKASTQQCQVRTIHLKRAPE